MLTIRAASASTEYPILLPNSVRFNDAIRTFEEQDRVPELIDYYETRETGHSLFPFPVRIEALRPRIGQLFWPIIGAARYAHALYLLDGWSLAKLRNDLGTANVVVLSFDDAEALADTPQLDEDGGIQQEEDASSQIEDVASFTYPMYLLAARPLVRTGSRPLFSDPQPAIDDAWIVVLVDKRYYWHNDAGVNKENDWHPASWTELLTTLAGNLYTTPTLVYVDAPSDNYPPPSPRWDAKRLIGRSTAHLLDAAAAVIGSRIVYTPDNVLSFQRPTAASRNFLLAYHNDLITNLRHEAGGAIDSTDLIPGIPGSAIIIAADTPFPPIQVTLPTGGGDTARKVIAWLDIGAQVGIPGTQWASDWFEWQKVPVDAMYTGVVPFPATGFLSHALIWHDGNGFYTKLAIPPDGYSPLFINLDEPVNDTILVQLTAKCYYDGSGDREADGFTPIPGTELTCPASLSCLERVIQYSGTRVYPVVPLDDDGNPCPFVYVEASPRQEYSPQCSPIYHISNIDLPVYPASSPRYHFAGLTQDEASMGSATWVNANYAEGEGNNAYATCVLSNGQTTHLLLASNFCFGLAGNAVITNVAIEIVAHASGSGVTDASAYLTLDGVTMSSNKSVGAALGTTDGTQTFSFSPTTWGWAALTPLELNQSGWGFGIQYTNGSGSSRTVSVDSIKAIVSFTPAGTTIPKHAVVRIVKSTQGDWYEMDQQPWVEIVRRTDAVLPDGTVAYLRYYDQNANDWRDGEQGFVIISG